MVEEREDGWQAASVRVPLGASGGVHQVILQSSLALAKLMVHLGMVKQVAYWSAE